MARPHKIDDYIVHEIADLIRYGALLPWSQLEQEGNPFTVRLGEKEVIVTRKEQIYLAIGKLVCDLRETERPRILRQIAKALKTNAQDEITQIRIAAKQAQAEYLPTDIKPTHKEIEEKLGRHLDRRTLKLAFKPHAPPVRPENRKKSPRPQKK